MTLESLNESAGLQKNVAERHILQLRLLTRVESALSLQFLHLFIE